MTSSDLENETLSSLYIRGRSKVLLDGTLKDGPGEMESVMDIFTRCSYLVRQLSLFSTNEQIEEVSTSDLRCVCISF